ncbi:Quinolinate phosphoribosyl transferase [Hysterangium stoloniferum]|nr:Quinolinate phosphoribosyl transferase [Hysterangium stoloniferum]
MEDEPSEINVVSLLDTDLYKFTMQQAVLDKFPDVQCTYRFNNRSHNMLFSRECIEAFKKAVSVITLTACERQFLEGACPFFTTNYLNYLSKYRFKPEQVSITFVESEETSGMGILEMEAQGLWVETILWEIPLMSLLSEAYFQYVDEDWSYDGQEEQAYHKGQRLLHSDITFSEFGTRRRRSYHSQELVVAGLKRAAENVKTGKLLGTSNVYFAYKYGMKPVGTIAHEWFMAIGAILGYEHVNAKALDLWHDVYGSENLIALTDTFTTDSFFRDFTPPRARLWKGLRQDSGDPFVYAPRVKAWYEKMGIDPKDHFIIYSDALTVELAEKLKTHCVELGMNATFGIGTHFTNDFTRKSSGGKEKSKPLNIVIKIASAGGKPCVKLSDEPSKHTGNPESINAVKMALGFTF